MNTIDLTRRKKQIRTTKALYLRRIWQYRLMHPPSAAVMRMRKIRGVNKAFAEFV
jgi:hypothetical protein